MSNERSETKTTDDTAPPAEKLRKSIGRRPDVDLALSAGFSEDRMNDPRIRELILQRAEHWIASGLESEDEAVKERADEFVDIIEDERRDIKGLRPLRRCRFRIGGGGRWKPDSELSIALKIFSIM